MAVDIYGNLKQTLLDFLEDSAGGHTWQYAKDRESYDNTQNDKIFTITFEQGRFGDRRNTSITTYGIRTKVFAEVSYEQENETFLDFHRQVKSIINNHSTDNGAVGELTNSIVNRQIEYTELTLLFDFTSFDK